MEVVAVFEGGRGDDCVVGRGGTGGGRVRRGGKLLLLEEGGDARFILEGEWM